jgi:hypothetical protein
MGKIRLRIAALPSLRGGAAAEAIQEPRTEDWIASRYALAMTIAARVLREEQTCDKCKMMGLSAVAPFPKA